MSGGVADLGGVDEVAFLGEGGGVEGIGELSGVEASRSSSTPAAVARAEVMAAAGARRPGGEPPGGEGIAQQDPSRKYDGHVDPCPGRV